MSDFRTMFKWYTTCKITNEKIGRKVFYERNECEEIS